MMAYSYTWRLRPKGERTVPFQEPIRHFQASVIQQDRLFTPARGGGGDFRWDPLILRRTKRGISRN